MKRINNIYSQIASVENIRKAYYNAKKGKAHYREVKMFEKDPEHYITELHEMLAREEFANSDYEVFEVRKPKKRIIYKLPFYPDRVIHHAIVQVLQPIWMSILIRDTYSTIPNRGIHDCVVRVKRALRDVKNTTYCLKIDVNKYYPSVDHEILKSILRKKIKDDKVIKLLSIIIDSAPGIPIGNYISQWFGNVYLAYLDHYIKEELGVKYYFRYADDMVFFGASKRYLKGVKLKVEYYLNRHLKLKLKGNWQIFPVASRGVDFLGYVFYHTHTLIRKSIKERYKKKLRNGLMNKKSQAAYWGWFKHADTFNLTNKYFDYERQ